MKRLASLLLLVPLAAVADPVRVEAVRVWEAPDNVRVVFDLSAPIEHTLFKLDGPDRVVIDIADATAAPVTHTANSGIVRNVRTGVRNGKDLRVVLDLSGPAQPRSFVLGPNDRYGHRLVVDLVPPQAAHRPSTPPPVVAQLRDLVIAIDAGHGGEDPGAIGPSGLREKDVTLGIARRLAALIEAEYGMQPVLVRSGDYYVKHHDRIARARAARADLFVSIHADAFTDPRAHGSSVYILSERGATSEAAQYLADRENASDLIGGVRLNDKDDMLASVLLDLSQAGVLSASRTVGSAVLEQLHGVGRVHKRDVQAANFRVLRAPDVPSILVETAFISNPTEEQRLRSAAHQDALARAVMAGIRTYFADHAPPQTLVAANGIGGGHRGAMPHVIARGETLSGIARRYNVSVQAIRSSNNIASDRIRVGDTLLIPNG